MTLDTYLKKLGLVVYFQIVLMSLAYGQVPAQKAVQGLEEKGYLGLYQAITDLKSDLTLMSVAAHPDDEHIEVLTYYRRKYGVNTVVVVATRGEGGQNEIGPELYRDLGVIRTYEMERSGAVSGAKYYNMNLEEFGYSKSAHEAFEKWGRKEPLEKLVLLIRKLRPDVIITNHDTTSGHGHHRATGILIRKAFIVAADANAFPEQLERGVRTWQPKRLFQRVFTPEEGEYVLPIGDFDVIRGESYAQIAARALSQQRSQGMDVFANQINAGRRFAYYKLVLAADGFDSQASDLTANLPDVFDRLSNVASVTDGVDDFKKLRETRNATLASFQENPEELPERLAHELRLWHDLRTKHPANESISGEIDWQIQKLEQAVYHALSLDFELATDDKKIVSGDELRIETRLFNGGNREIRVKAIRLLPRTDWFGQNLPNLSAAPNSSLTYNQGDTVAFNLRIPNSARFTVPKTKIFYETARWQPLLTASVAYELDGLTLHASPQSDFDIVPDLHVTIETGERIFPVHSLGKERDIIVSLQNNTSGPLAGEVRLEWFALAGNRAPVTLGTQPFSLTREDEATSSRFRVTLPADVVLGEYKLRAVAASGTGNSGHPVLSAESLTHVIDVKTIPEPRVGVVRSYDGTLQAALQQMDIESELLSSEDLQWGDLTQFDTIILDIRAYLAREDLRRNNSRVLDYVKNGGNLVVMYHKTFEWNPEFGNPQWSPFTLVLGTQRVTRENASVKVLAPEHPLFNVPNQITPADWQGWIQERGLYFPDRWNANYESLLAMSDPEEPDHTGSYLVANYGKGTYIYTSLVWYRQLRALVPGAFRNLANMVAYAETRKQYIGGKR